MLSITMRVAGGAPMLFGVCGYEPQLYQVTEIVTFRQNAVHE